ncbi:MAG: hypothetical protein ACTS42_00885 [Candidatus Hodgkinia cicadicola]
MGPKGRNVIIVKSLAVLRITKWEPLLRVSLAFGACLSKEVTSRTNEFAGAERPLQPFYCMRSFPKNWMHFPPIETSAALSLTTKSCYWWYGIL